MRFQLSREFWEGFPDVERVIHTDFNDPSQGIVCLNLRACPKEYHGAITSGQSTSTLNSDLCLRLNLTYPPGVDVALESFLVADVTLHAAEEDLHVNIKNTPKKISF